MKITSVESRLYRYPLEPPFRAAWYLIPNGAPRRRPS